jgi:hypothetical protein
MMLIVVDYLCINIEKQTFLEEAENDEKIYYSIKKQRKITRV